MRYRTGMVGCLGNSPKNRSYVGHPFMQSLECAVRVGMSGSEEQHP